MLVDVFAGFEVSGKQAEHALEVVGLSTNKNMVPYDTRPPMNPSGIRIGTPAATTRGMGEKEMIEIADIFAQTIKNHTEESLLMTQKQRVLELCKNFPIYS
jgi:glycine hydroxymethyltransferase